jgi:ABC-type nitrate/sulfonate/bicarbonate transport system substrate-binding protein
MRTTRHLLGVVAIALAGCGSATTGERPEQDATLLLDTPPAAVHAGIASALARGYDDAEGVHLKLRRASRKSDAATALTTGGADLAVVDLHELARHPDLVAVMAIVQRPLLTVNARGPALPPKPWHAPLLKALGRPAQKLGRRDIKPGGTPVEELGEPVYPELVLATSRDTLEESPSLVRAAVAALARGYRFTLTDPASSAQDLRLPGAATQLDRLDTAFVGTAGVPGVLDTGQIARWRRWAARHGLPANVAAEPRFAREAASADEG